MAWRRYLVVMNRFRETASAIYHESLHKCTNVCVCVFVRVCVCKEVHLSERRK